MENIVKIYELLEAISDCHLIELLPLDINPSLLEILEDDIIQDLERLLNKIKTYAYKATKVTNE